MGLNSGNIREGGLEDVQTATPIQLEVNTNSVIPVDVSTVRLNGTLVEIDKRGSSLDVDLFFEFGSLEQGLVTTTNTNQLSSANTFNIDAEGIDTSKELQYRVVAKYAYVTDVGKTDTFSPSNPAKYTRTTTDSFTVDTVSRYSRSTGSSVSFEVTT